MAEYNIGEYGDGANWAKIKVPLHGAGEYIQFGFVANTEGSAFSMSDWALKFKLGRISD